MSPRASAFHRRGRMAAPLWADDDERRLLDWLRGVVAGEPSALGALDGGMKRLVRAHRLDALAFATGATAPRGAAAELVADTMARRLAAAARSVVDSLAEAGVDCVVLKGPALGERYWGGAWRRPSTDVDVLVCPLDAARAGDVLRAHGYRTVEEGVPGWYERRWFYHSALAAPERKSPTVELHWDFMRSGFARNDIGALIAAGEQVETCGVTLPTPSTAWQLVTNAAHCVHEMFRVRLLLDVALVARAALPDDWRLAVFEARRAGVATMLYYAAAVSSEHLGWRLNGEVEALRPSALRDAAARRYLAGLSHFALSSRAAMQLHHFANPLLTCDGSAWLTRVPYSLLTDRGNLAGDVERLRRRWSRIRGS